MKFFQSLVYCLLAVCVILIVGSHSFLLLASGSFLLSKKTAYLLGDTVVVTLVDVDMNTSSNSVDTLPTALKVTGSNYTVGSDLVLDLVETGINTSTFLATIRTGTMTIGGIGTGGGEAGSGENDGTIKAVQEGIADIIFTAPPPSPKNARNDLSFSSFDATLAFNANSYDLGSYAVITLADAERNTKHTEAETLLNDVFIQTSTSNSTKVRMVETGADAGTFVGSIQVVSSGGTAELSRIQAVEGDTLTITYIDEVNTTGSSRTVTDTALVTTTPIASPTSTATATPIFTPIPTITQLPTVTTGEAIDKLTYATLTGTVNTHGLSTTVYFEYWTASNTYRYTTSTQMVNGSSDTPISIDTNELPLGINSPYTFYYRIVAQNSTGTSYGDERSFTARLHSDCFAESLEVSPSRLTLRRNQSSTVTVTLLGNGGNCPLEGETVTTRINKSGKKRISILPKNGTTDENGKTEFTIIAKRLGRAKITFKTSSLKKSIIVIVKSK